MAAAIHAFPTIEEEEQPLYDGKSISRKRHLTIIDDAVVDQVIEACGFTAAGIYTLLERRSNRDGICRNISYSTIQERGGISRRHAIRLIQQLQEAGFLEIRERIIRGRHVENEFFLPRHLSGDTPSANNDQSGDMVVTLGSDTSGDTPPVSGDMGGDTSGDTPIKKSKESNHESNNDTPTVNAEAFSPRPQTDSAPFITLWAIFDAQQRDVYSLSPAERGKQCAAAARIIKTGITESDVRGIVAWLGGWMSGVDAFDVERSIPKWRAAGMPTGPQEKPKPEKKVAYNSPRAKGPVY